MPTITLSDGSTQEITILEDGTIIDAPSMSEIESVEPQTEPQTETVEGCSTPRIPENPDIPLVNSLTSRFNSAVWYEEVQKQKILLGGCGGIGSWVALLLSRMCPDVLSIVDPDTVEVGNLSGQMYSRNLVNMSKVSAMMKLTVDFSSYYIDGIGLPIKNISYIHPVVMCGFDNMAARRCLFNKWLAVDNVPKSSKLFIDGRLAAEEFQVLSLTGDNEEAIRRYKTEFLFDDSEAEPTVCSYKQTSHIANMIASVMVNIFTNFCANLTGTLPLPREVPFLTTYRGDFMDFKTFYCNGY